MDGGAWWAAVHWVARTRARLNDFTFTFHFHALEKEMATHSSALAWRMPGMGEPSGLLSMGSHRVGHDWSDLAAAAASYILGSQHCTTHYRISEFIIRRKCLWKDMNIILMILTLLGWFQNMFYDTHWQFWLPWYWNWALLIQKSWHLVPSLHGK